MMLDELVARLRGSIGPDGALDKDILCAFGARYELDWGPEFYWPDGGRFYDHDITKKIDHALAFAAHILPGCYWRCEKSPPAAVSTEGPFWASCGYPGEQEAAVGNTPALAICIAALAAWSARNPQAMRFKATDALPEGER